MAPWLPWVTHKLFLWVLNLSLSLGQKLDEEPLVYHPVVAKKVQFV